MLDIKRNNEVFLPSFNFVAAANAITYCGAIPHFLDINKEDLSVDPKKFEIYLKENFKNLNGVCINKKTRRTVKAIIVPHIFGHSAKIEEIIKIAKKGGGC